MEKGYVSFSESEDFDLDEEGAEVGTGKYILIDLVYVAPEFRGQGVARKMLLDTLEELKKQPLPVKLVALPKEKGIDQDRLVEFYEECGFSVSEQQGCAGVIMEL